MRRRPGLHDAGRIGDVPCLSGTGGDLDIALIGNNLTDSVQRNHVSFNKDYRAAAGTYVPA